MPRFELEIGQAYANAPVVDDSQLGRPMVTLGDQFEGFDGSSEVCVVENRIFLKRSSDFRTLLRELGFSGLCIEDIATYEEQRADAALLLGIRVTAFAVCLNKFENEEGFRVAHYLHARFPQEKPLGRLAKLAFLAHPARLSSGDQANLQAMEATVQQIGDWVIEHNRTHPDKIPMPLSYTYGQSA